MSMRDRIARQQAQKDVDHITREIYKRSLQGKDTSVADLMPLVLIRSRYNNGYTTTSKQGMEDAMRQSMAYCRALMRQAAAQHPHVAHRIRL